jgi:hypothetical protein
VKLLPKFLVHHHHYCLNSLEGGITTTKKIATVFVRILNQK